MPSPTHEDISLKAYHLWEARGRPEGAADDTWIEAERLLNDDAAEHENAEKLPSPQPAASVAAHAIAPTPVEQKAIVAEVQKQQARTPQVPHHTGPKAQPAPPGKPVWKQAHSA
jgi:hypothetical protein